MFISVLSHAAPTGPRIRLRGFGSKGHTRNFWIEIGIHVHHAEGTDHYFVSGYMVVQCRDSEFGSQAQIHVNAPR